VKRILLDDQKARFIARGSGDRVPVDVAELHRFDRQA
jgi:hypothetical protein